jgi:hypothetical protein
MTQTGNTALVDYSSKMVYILHLYFEYLVNCKFCTGMTDLKATDEIVTHMKVQHLNVPDDDVKRLI